MSAELVGLSLLVLGVLLLAGKLVRVRSRRAQRLFLPSSIIAGSPALLAGPFRRAPCSVRSSPARAIRRC